MTGYCSNSPLRCPRAQTMTLMNEPNNHCAYCGMVLIPAGTHHKSAQAESRALLIALWICVIITLLLVYIYYASFV